MTTLIADREALVAELRRHIGAHSDIVANDLIASGVVVDAAALADDEALVAALMHRWGCEDDDQDAYDAARADLVALAAAFAERGERR